jgi:ATP-dependent protease ClpP protease subunit
MRCEVTGEVFDLSAIVDQITNAQEDVELVVNSPGGDVFAGFQLVNAISKCQHKVTAHIEVMAASIAAIIALACDKVVIGKNDILMLHNCWTITAGNKEQLQQDIDMMAAVDKVIHNIVEEHCYDDTMTERINAGDVWLVGEEVVEMFDHVELRDENEAKLAAGASLAKLVLLAREAEEERKKKQNVPPQPEPEPEPEPENPENHETLDDPDNTDSENTDGEGGEGGDTQPEPAGYEVTEKLKALLKEAEELE